MLYRSSHSILLNGISLRSFSVSNKAPITLAYFNMIISFAENLSIIAPHIFSIRIGTLNSVQSNKSSKSLSSLVISSSSDKN